MKYLGRILFLFLFVLLFTISNVYAWEIDQTTSVQSIIDGDTFYIPEDRVRLADIDAPDLGETGYNEAKNELAKLISGKTVYLDTDPNRDPYERIIAVIYVKYNSTHYKNVNKALLNLGVVEYWDHPNEFNPYSWTLYVQYAEPPSPPPSPTPDPPPSPPPKPPKPKEYDLNITIEGSGTTVPEKGIYTYEKNSLVIINAIPSEGWMLSHWNYDMETYNKTEFDSIEITITKDHNLIAVFKEKPPDCKINFTVYTNSNKTLENAKIRSIYHPDKQDEIILYTDQNGEAYTEFIYYGDYSFNISKNGYVTKSNNISLEEKEYQNITIYLVEIKGKIFIVLKDKQGEPLQNVTVISEITPNGQKQVSGYTDNLGCIEFNEVLPGNYCFDVSGKLIEKKTISTKTSVKNEFIELIQCTIPTYCNVGFTVSDLEGNPLNNVTVFSRNHPENQSLIVKTFNEKVKLSEIYPGEYEFVFRKKDFKSVHLFFEFTGLEEVYVPEVVLEAYSVTSFRNWNIGITVYAVLTGVVLIFLHTQENLPDACMHSGEKIEAKPKFDNDRKPKYWNTSEGQIIESIILEGVLELGVLKYSTDLEEEDFWKYFYELLMKGDIEATSDGKFRVKDDLSKDWVRFSK